MKVNTFQVTDIKIEHGVPLPVRERSRWARLLMKMRHGDSFVIPRKLTGCVYSYAKRLNKKFICQVIDRNFTRMWFMERGKNGQG